ncbi:MAG: antitermination protein NusB, partial [Desulfovibrio sp.]|nr:antitermination protein NusB [Desulfovibrio sp.]
PAPLLERGPGSLFGEGVFSFPAAGSQMAIRELGLRDWREPVWDCCAGAGGKTLALLDAGVPVTLASDPSPSRPRAMLAECRRLKIAAPGLVRASALAPPLTVWRGNILADVPCSGSGVLARRPDLRLKKPDIAAFARLQLGILESCASLLQPGKELAYITCSRNPAENEELAARFLKKHPEMEQTRSWQTPVEHPWLEGMGGVVLRKKTRGSR